MTTNTKIDEVRIIQSGLIVLTNNKQIKEISFSELDKIYIKMIKFKVVHKIGLIIAAFVFVFLAMQFVSFEKVVFLSLLSTVPFLMNNDFYKSYGLRICLKDGTVFRKKVSLKEKEKDVLLVNSVRRAHMDYYNSI